MYIFKVNTTSDFYKKYNGMLCTVVDAKREDGLIEVYVQKLDSFILLAQDELEDVDE